MISENLIEAPRAAIHKMFQDGDVPVARPTTSGELSSPGVRPPPKEEAVWSDGMSTNGMEKEGEADDRADVVVVSGRQDDEDSEEHWSAEEPASADEEPSSPKEAEAPPPAEAQAVGGPLGGKSKSPALVSKWKLVREAFQDKERLAILKWVQNPDELTEVESYGHTGLISWTNPLFYIGLSCTCTMIVRHFTYMECVL